MHPYEHTRGQTITTDVLGVAVDRAFLAHFIVAAADAAAADTDGVHASMNGAAHAAVKTAITNPAVPRNITATAGGTEADIKAIQVIITGTNYADEIITETLPAFTVDTAGTVEGSKAFKTVTQIDVPAHDGAAATTVIGWGNKFGLPYMLAADEQAIVKLFDAAADAGTVTPDVDEIEKNVFAPAGTPDGAKNIELYIVI